jgi:hypothetical protein
VGCRRRVLPPGHSSTGCFVDGSTTSPAGSAMTQRRVCARMYVHARSRAHTHTHKHTHTYRCTHARTPTDTQQLAGVKQGSRREQVRGAASRPTNMTHQQRQASRGRQRGCTPAPKAPARCTGAPAACTARRAVPAPHINHPPACQDALWHVLSCSSLVNLYPPPLTPGVHALCVRVCARTHTHTRAGGRSCARKLDPHPMGSRKLVGGKSTVGVAEQLEAL